MAKRKTKHDRLVEEAETAISAVHSDTTVSKNQTRQSLRDLADHAETLRTSVSEDGHEEAE